MPPLPTESGVWASMCAVVPIWYRPRIGPCKRPAVERSSTSPVHMLRRLTERRKVARAILFLCSDASFITCTELPVDGRLPGTGQRRSGRHRPLRRNRVTDYLFGLDLVDGPSVSRQCRFVKRDNTIMYRERERLAVINIDDLHNIRFYAHKVVGGSE